MVKKWKQQYGAIYQTTVCDIDFIWRELTNHEYKYAMEQFENEHAREDYVCGLCVLSPGDFDWTTCEAGIACMLTLEILKSSGFAGTSSQEFLSIYRNELRDIQNMLPVYICAAFPRFEPEEIEHWSARKIIWYLTRAEQVMAARGTPLQYPEEGGM